MMVKEFTHTVDIVLNGNNLTPRVYQDIKEQTEQIQDTGGFIRPEMLQPSRPGIDKRITRFGFMDRQLNSTQGYHLQTRKVASP
jgi:hypothetical protein